MARQRININIHDDTHRLAKAIATIKDCNLNDYLADAVAEAIASAPEAQPLKK